jgi:arylsulfatase A-like enzyme
MSVLLPGIGTAAERPNIVYILADDLGWQDLGYLGKEVRTPNIDRLAQGAVRLNQFYVQPYSTQTRAALLTGRYPMRYGLQTQSILPSSPFGLPADERTLAQALKDAGYRTALVGKWQLGHAKPEMGPLRRGFDYHYGPLAGQVDPLRKTNALGPDWYRNDRLVKEDGYVTTLLGKDAVNLIAKHDAATPLFLFLSFTAPAAPLHAPKEYLDRNAHIRDDARRTYAGMVSALDDAIGLVTGALEKRGMLDNTIIVFHSDNGGAVANKFPTGDSDVIVTAADNGPYRNGKGSLYEGGVRVPALIRWPKTLDEGIVNGMIHITDLYPTLLVASGAKLDQRKALDGIDQWPAIRDDKPSPRKEILLSVEDLRGGIRMGDWKLIVYATLPQRVELFDVPHDPGEEDNAAERNPELVARLQARLNDYAWEMVPSKYVDELSRPRKSDMPMIWGMNPVRHGATSETDSRRDPALTVERADQPGR